MDKSYKMIYMTCADNASAEIVIKELISERQIACANIIPHVTSFYLWEGQVESSNECVVIAKTVAANVETVIERIKELHSYECPCVVVLNMEAGNPDYFNWLQNSVNICLPNEVR